MVLSVMITKPQLLEEHVLFVNQIIQEMVVLVLIVLFVNVIIAIL